MPRHIIIKLFKVSDKEKILKAVRVGGKHIRYRKKNKGRMKTVFSLETTKTR